MMREIIVLTEPTMDGTASLIYLLAAKENEARQLKSN